MSGVPLGLAAEALPAPNDEPKVQGLPAGATVEPLTADLSAAKPIPPPPPR